jgi:hypothetical protein
VPGADRESDKSLFRSGKQLPRTDLLVRRNIIVKPFAVIPDAKLMYGMEIPVNQMNWGKQVQLQPDKDPFPDVQFRKRTGTPQETGPDIPRPVIPVQVGDEIILLRLQQRDQLMEVPFVQVDLIQVRVTGYEGVVLFLGKEMQFAAGNLLP